MERLISLQAAIDAICEDGTWLEQQGCTEITMVERKQRDVDILSDLPSAQHTLYGYNLEHLAYIARVMEKEGVTAEYAVRTFDDISRAIRMIIDEAQEKVEDMLNEQFNKQTSGD